MSNWPRGHADFSSSNWTARTPDRCRITSWSPADKRHTLHPSRWFSGAFIAFILVGVVPFVGVSLGLIGQ